METIVHSIRENPDDPTHWHALASWLADNGREEEAAVVRVFWPAIADTVALGVPVAEALEQVRRNAMRLGKAARDIEERSYGP